MWLRPRVPYISWVKGLRPRTVHKGPGEAGWWVSGVASGRGEALGCVWWWGMTSWTARSEVMEIL